MITVSEALKNSCLKKFPVVCGLRGITNEVIKTGIVDYEFSLDGFFEDNDQFGCGDFLISSMMFTKGNEDLLLRAVSRLVDMKVSALAIKNVFFKSIPEKVVSCCDFHSFPIILFDNSLYFEDIITEIDNLISVSDWISSSEKKLATLFERDLPRYEVESISKELDLPESGFIASYCLRPLNPYGHSQMKHIINNYRKNPHSMDACRFFKLRKSFIALLSSQKHDSKHFNRTFKDFLNITGLSQDKFIVGASCIHDSQSKLDHCIKESVWSCQAATIKGRNRCDFSRLGSWSVLLSSQKTDRNRMFMERYLGPILDSDELLKTAEIFILSDCNPKTSSSQLNIHENTLRYRINKIRSLIEPDSSDFQFYENLSLAVKIRLIENSKFKA